LANASKKEKEMSIKIGDKVAVSEWPTVKLIVSEINGDIVTCLQKDKNSFITNLYVNIKILVEPKRATYKVAQSIFRLLNILPALAINSSKELEYCLAISRHFT
jgi:hypothetical protein